MFKIKASIIGVLVFANMAMTLALNSTEDSVFAPPTSMPSSMPSEEPTETPVPPSMVVGCLRIPGDVNSNFNRRSPASKVFCDEVDGTCADFVKAIKGLPDRKDRLVKSIFACNAINRANTQATSQTLFDRVKNDKDAIETILKAVRGNGIMTGGGRALTRACSAERYPCCPSGGCSSNGWSFTITPDSCSSYGSCLNVAPKAMIFDSCTGQNSCRNFGEVRRSRSDGSDVIGNKIIGPNACTAPASCQNLGKNIYGSIRVHDGACSGAESCMDLGRRGIQGRGVRSPVIADIIIGDNACQGQNACTNAHRGDSKRRGSLFIEDGACASTNSCNGVAYSNAAVDDLVIASGTCARRGSCRNCVRTDMCSRRARSTYTIKNPSKDCQRPNPYACS